MGNTISCNCCETSDERAVVMMRADGSILKLKRGMQTREVMLAYSGHSVVRFDSDRTVLCGGAELESNRVYFLVPEDQARCSKTFEHFQEMLESKGFGVPVKLNKETVASREALESRRGWAPQLRTIPEIISFSMSTEAAKEAGDSICMKKSPLARCSVDEQLTVASPLPSTISV